MVLISGIKKNGESFGIDKYDRKMFEAALQSLEESGEIMSFRNRKWKLNEKDSRN